MSKKGTIGITQFLNKKFKKVETLHEDWQSHLGGVHVDTKICIYGESANGKTEYCLQLAKAFAKAGLKVYYNSAEQGISATLQAGIKRQNLKEVAGKVLFIKESWQQMIDRLDKRKSPQVIFIDSRDFFQLTYKEFVSFCEKFTNKIIVIICQADGSEPKGKSGSSIKFHCDVKIRVKGFKAYPSGRLGGFNAYVIWEDGVKIYKDRVNEMKGLRGG